MNPFDRIKEQIDEDLHHKLPKKWKKIGNILVADFSQIDKKIYLIYLINMQKF